MSLRRAGRWLGIAALVLVAVVLLAGFASYRVARQAAYDYLGPMPPDFVQLRPGALLPLYVSDGGLRGWRFAFGPDDPALHGVEVYVSFSGQILCTNPRLVMAFVRRMRPAAHEKHRPVCYEARGTA